MQDAEKGRLHFRTDVANLVEKDGAAVGNFKFTFMALNGTGKGAFFVTEKIAFEQTFRYGGAIEFEVVFVVDAAVAVDKIRHQFFAGSGFSGDEDSGIGVRHLVNHFPQFPDRFAFAHHLVGFLGAAQFFFEDIDLLE